MVERLKAAIEKARLQRDGVAHPPAAAPPTPAAAQSPAWEALHQLSFSRDALPQQRVVSDARTDPAHGAFDVLRTKLLRLCAEKGWRRIGFTSPTKGCGKTLVVANLAFSLARHPTARTVVLDLDLRSPALATRIAARTDRVIGDLLSGHVGPETALERVGDRVAFGLSSRSVADSDALTQSASAAAAIRAIMDRYAPTLLLCDLPPLLLGDDALGMLGLLDGVVLIIGGGKTTAAEITQCEALLPESIPLVGVALNRAEDATAEAYAYT